MSGKAVLSWFFNRTWKRVVWVILVLILAYTGYRYATRIRGSGKVVTENRLIQPFHELEVSGAFQVRVFVDSSHKGLPSLEVTGDDNLVPLVQTEVSGETLEIERRTRAWIDPTVPLTLKIRIAKLREVDVSGAVDLEARGVDGEALSVSVSGSADILLTGRVGNLELDLSGSSDVDAQKLQAKKAELDISGSAKVSVCATQDLDVDISGSGKVYVYCEPKHVEQDIAGSGRLIRK